MCGIHLGRHKGVVFSVCMMASLDQPIVMEFYSMFLVGDGCPTPWDEDSIHNFWRTIVVHEFGGELHHLLVMGERHRDDTLSPYDFGTIICIPIGRSYNLEGVELQHIFWHLCGVLITSLGDLQRLGRGVVTLALRVTSIFSCSMDVRV